MTSIEFLLSVAMTQTQADVLIFLFTTFNLAVLVFAWVMIDFARRILDVLHTSALRESARRDWVRKEHES